MNHAYHQAILHRICILFPFLDPSIRDLRPEQTFRLYYIVVKSDDYVILKVSI
jgi:hypothetical protein